MSDKIVDMHEIILWSNCSNNCKFCWQKKIKNQNCILNEEEKIKSINKAKEFISNLEYSDVLLVGGEICDPTSNNVTDNLISLFMYIRDKLINDELRLLFINTNLLYNDLSIVRFLCDMFKDIPDKLKLTTSYDLEGRFQDNKEELFLNNLSRLTTEYPSINIVVNTILTKKVCTSNFSAKEFIDKYKVRSINFIPYIPIYYGDSLTPSYGQVVSKLYSIDGELPGYFDLYVNNINLKQKKILREYHKDTNSLVECTSKHNECGHNINFNKVFKNGECYACELMKIYKERTTTL